jgi:hypothetical protein
MIGPIRFGVRAVRQAWLVTLALDATSKERYEKAQSLLRKVYELAGDEGPSPRVTIEANILYGLIACRLKDIDLCTASIRMAVSQLKGNVRGYSVCDKDYLRYYCRTILEFSASRPDDQLFQESLAIGVNFASLQFDKVQANLKRNFPVTRRVASED